MLLKNVKKENLETEEFGRKEKADEKTTTVAEVDIGGVEARHASIRRHLIVKSCQTNVQDFIDVSCDWICQQKRLAVQGSKVVCYVYELVDGEVDVSKTEFTKTIAQDETILR